MATSGSTDWNPTRNQIVKAALRKISSLDSHNSLDSSELADAVFALNAMVKEWMARGVDLWLRREVTLFLQKDTTNYSLGSTAHITDSYVETAMRVAAVATDTTMEVDSTTGMTAGDNIGVVLDDDSIHWTTIAPAGVTDSDTLELTTGIPTAGTVAIDNEVYTYTTKSTRPQKILRVLRRSTSGIDTHVDIIGRNDHFDLSDKDSAGPVNQVVYDPQLTAGVLRVWPISTADHHKLVMIVRDVVEDFDTASDNAEFPAEWGNALVWNLALELSAEYPVGIEKLKLVTMMAGTKFRSLWEYDVEESSVFFTLDAGHG